MRRGALLALVLAAACTARGDRKLPGATFSASPAATPHFARVRAPQIACGDDVALDGHAAPDIRYAYAYDDRARLVHAEGTYSAGGADDTVDYRYDHLDHLTHSLETRGWGESRYETTADYDTLGDLVDYTSDETAVAYHDTWHYTFSAFTDAGQPTVEIVGELAQPTVRYQLAYDAANRIAFVAQDGGGTTTYTYDDDARTTTIDMGNGAVHGVIGFDDENRELSETWGGTDPTAIATESVYDYDGDRLVGLTYRAGTTGAPKEPVTAEVDVLRYDCTQTALRPRPQ